MGTLPYVGRFAPSPTGLLHAGSLVAALASWLDARSHGGRWLVRIEDLDGARNIAGAAEAILAQLGRCGLRADGEVIRQSARTDLYGAALQRLVAADAAYPCACSRRDLLTAVPAKGEALGADERVYPGTCRGGLHGRAARSWRFAVDATPEVRWLDRRLGPQRQDVARSIGDFVIRRADGVWAYQLAVVVDDAAQGITDVVRGEDLAGNTARQILLQQALGLPTPRYLHTPLVRADDGQKLSKQTGALPLALDEPVAALQAAGQVLGLDRAGVHGTTVAGWLAAATTAWPAVLATQRSELSFPAGIIED